LPDRPHIGLNLIFVVPGATGGIETYVRELVRAFGDSDTGFRWTAFVSSHEAATDLCLHEAGMRQVTIPFHPRTRSGWVPGEMTRLPAAAHRASCDLVHSLASTGPVSGTFRRVTTIHDLVYRLFPQQHRGWRYLGPKLLVSRVLIPLAARRSHRVIALSRTAAADLIRLLRLDESNVDIIPHGPGLRPPERATREEDLRARYRLGDRPLILTVSAKWPHKNLSNLIRAAGLLPADERPVFVFPGYPTPHEGELRRLAQELRLDDDVRFLDWVSDQDLEGLYRTSSCCVLPSLYEGFGLPALEALRRGVPLACSSGGALEELAGGVAVLFDPWRPEALATAIHRILSDPALAARLRRDGPERAKRYSWAAAAAATVRTYERVLTE
jgi:glycosyltransferase involved in cell wall biosynthesis